MNLSNHFRMLESRFNALSIRERVITTFLVVSVFFAIGQFLVFVPIQAQYRGELAKQLQAKNSNETLENEFAQLQHFMSDQTDVIEVQALDQELLDINAQIDQLGNRMVSPDQMSSVLQGLLSKQSNMRIVSLEKLPLELPEKTSAVQLVRHRLRLTLHGNYFDSLRYLQQMEELPWRVYWDKLEYHVDTYPNALLSIEIATLGESKEWISG